MYDGEDRVRQVNEIDEVAQSLTSSSVTVDDYEGDVAAYVTDLVSDWLSSAEVPTWWDGHDTDLLRERVRKYAS